MAALSAPDLEALLLREPLWKLEAGKLVRDWTFKDFVAAMAFVNAVANLAERLSHHPDIDIRYNRVRLALITHDSNGITARDAAMATELSTAFPA